MKLSELNEQMAEYNGNVAYGSECNAWQDFHEDCHARFFCSPYDPEAEDIDVPADVAEYWEEVADGSSSDYDEEGGRK